MAIFGHMDFCGQHDAEVAGKSIILFFFVVATAVAFAVQDIRIALVGWLFGLALSLIVAVPPWAVYCKHPMKWLPATTQPATSASTPKKGKKHNE